MPYGKVAINTVISSHTPNARIVPDDIKADIARVVRSVDIHDGLTGGRCAFRTFCGWMVLRHLGIPVRRAIGGVAYQAGPDPVRDVVGFCGPNWMGCIYEGVFVGHVWLISGDNIVDFSVGDWPAVSGGRAALYMPGTPDMDPIQWAAPPPEFIWAAKVPLLTAPGANGLQLGQMWYTGFKGQPPDLDAGLDEYMPILKPVMRTLMASCQAHRLRERLLAQ